MFSKSVEIVTDKVLLFEALVLLVVVKAPPIKVFKRLFRFLKELTLE